MNTKKIYLLASAALLAFASCMDEMQEMEHQSGLLKQIVMTTQDFETETGSRTLYQITEEAVTCTWAAHDTVGVFPDKGIQTCFPMASGAGTKNATFDGGGWALKDGYTYAAYYPFISEIFLDKNAVPVNYVGQMQTGNASVDHLGAYDYMVAMPTAPEFGSAQFTFRHLSALVQLKLTVPQPATLSSVKLVAENKAFVLEGKVDIMAETPVITPVTSAKEIVLNLQDVATTKENQVITLYLMLPPVDLSTVALNAIITSDKDTQQIELVGQNFQAGKVYGLSEVKDESDTEIEEGYKEGVVNIVEAGTMKKLLGDGYLNITSLKVVGPINGDDVNCLRQMLGGYEFTEIGQLATLDLSGAIIVEGGGYYYKEYITSDNVVGEDMFYFCKNLQNMVLPVNVIAIENSAFSSCESLISIDIPESAISLGGYVFQNCHSLTSVDIPECVSSIGTSFFYGCCSLSSIHIPNSVTSIGSWAFYGCSALKSIQIPVGVTNIGEDAFTGCSTLTTIDIPDKVVSIGANAFSNCTSLRTITIGDGVTSIGNYAFLYCYSLTSVKIGKGVTSIGIWAFKDCTSLPSIVIPDNVTSIGKYAFTGCSQLASVNIGKGVTSIGTEAFGCCSSLTSVDIPDNVTSMGEYIFRDCSSLISITIGNGVSSIWKGTFDTCTSLTSVTVGNSLTYIGYSVFQDCPSLSNFYCYAVTPPEIESGYSSSFDLCYEKATLHVSTGCSSKYEASAWKTYFPNIVEMK